MAGWGGLVASPMLRLIHMAKSARQRPHSVRLPRLCLCDSRRSRSLVVLGGLDGVSGHGGAAGGSLARFRKRPLGAMEWMEAAGDCRGRSLSLE